METKELAQRRYGLPMPYHGEDRSLSLTEWNRYRERQRWHHAHDSHYVEKWNRPTREMAEEAWTILSNHGLRLEDLRPPIYPRITVLEQAEVDTTIKQALVVALDAFVEAGRVKVSKKSNPIVIVLNRVFDGLAQGWSDHFRRVVTAGRADRARDMRPETVKAARRDLLRNGIDLALIWDVVACAWSGVYGQNPLYWTTPARVKQGRKVTLKPGQALEDFERTVLWSGYEREGLGWSILPADKIPHDRVADLNACMETPYNVVESGPRAKAVMNVLERARLNFNVSGFRREIEGAAKEVRDQFGVAYEQSISMPDWAPIKTRIRREINRRYQALDLWPMATSGKLDRARAFVVAPEDFIPVPSTYQSESSMRGRWFRWTTVVPGIDRSLFSNPLDLSGLDVSASQTTILAVLLGLTKLEDIAGRESFNSYLARSAWERRTEFLTITGTDVDYKGPDDEQLRELVKQLWMRVLYGAPTAWTVLDQWEDSKDVGPGWKKGKRKGHITRAAGNFLKSIPQYKELTAFLKACRRIAARVDLYQGFEFTDPFDGIRVRWNPIERIDIYVESNGLKILVSVPGETKTSRRRDDDEPPGVAGHETTGVHRHPPNDQGEYAIDRKKLRKMIAPCLTHALDAAFAGHVVEHLARLGAKDIVAIHDAFFSNGDLDAALEPATRAWFKSLGSVYADLLRHLAPGDRTFRPMLEKAQAAWEARVAREAWPSFRMKPDVPVADWHLIPGR